MKYKKSIFILLFFIAGIFGLYSYSEHQKIAERKLAQDSFGWKFPVVGFPDVGSGDVFQLAYSSLRDPGGIPQGLPVRLIIPAIGVNTAIEDALITHDGKMDVPAGSINVAWFALGPPPGRVGSAVIGGHYGIDNGVPKVFYNLDKLRPGDIVQIINDRGETLSFIVRSKKIFDREDDATTVFTSQDGLAHLNLITCEGVWNQVDDTYPERLVVFTDAISTQDLAIITPDLPTTAESAPTPTPAPATAPTPTPTSTLAPEASPPPTPAQPTTIPSPTPIPDELIASLPLLDLPGDTVQVLFATPLDAGITTSLLSLGSFIVFRIFRR